MSTFQISLRQRHLCQYRHYSTHTCKVHHNLHSHVYQNGRWWGLLPGYVVFHSITCTTVEFGPFYSSTSTDDSFNRTYVRFRLWKGWIPPLESVILIPYVGWWRLRRRLATARLAMMSAFLSPFTLPLSVFQSSCATF